MPAKWQQWMPFKIDKFRGSPSVQAMHPASRAGYIYLLISAWQKDDCTVSSDAMDLAQESGLGDELWVVHGARILRNFSEIKPGRLQNTAEFEEWEEARVKYEQNRAARSENGKRGANARWLDSKPMAKAMQPDGNSHSESEKRDGEKCPTDTGTDTEGQKQKSSRGKRERATKTTIADARHAEFKEAIRAYWDSKNCGIEMPWGPMEGKQLGMWLREAPHTTLEQFKGLLRGRYKSDVNHGDRPSMWIRKVTSYAQPIDRYNKPTRERLMERIQETSPAQLSSALTVTSPRSQKQLSAVDGKTLAVLVYQMAQR